MPLIAFLYAAVGHGGASGYLALMSIFSFAADDVKTIALTLNLFVAGIAFFHYYRRGFFGMKLFSVLALASIPMAYLGGQIQLQATVYFYFLAGFLLLAAFRLLNPFGMKQNEIRQYKLLPVLILGGGIGFLSGLLGIGGGIILSPIILLFGWSDAKTTAGISALFIVVNSAAGLVGKYSYGLVYPQQMPIIIALVMLGGLLGAYLGAAKWSNLIIKKVLGVVLLLAAIKILLAS